MVFILVICQFILYDLFVCKRLIPVKVIGRKMLIKIICCLVFQAVIKTNMLQAVRMISQTDGGFKVRLPAACYAVSGRSLVTKLSTAVITDVRFQVVILNKIVSVCQVKTFAFIDYAGKNPECTYAVPLPKKQDASLVSAADECYGIPGV